LERVVVANTGLTPTTGKWLVGIYAGRVFECRRDGKILLIRNVLDTARAPTCNPATCPYLVKR